MPPAGWPLGQRIPPALAGLNPYILRPAYTRPDPNWADTRCKAIDLTCFPKAGPAFGKQVSLRLHRNRLFDFWEPPLIMRSMVAINVVFRALGIILYTLCRNASAVRKPAFPGSSSVSLPFADFTEIALINIDPARRGGIASATSLRNWGRKNGRVSVNFHQPHSGSRRGLSHEALHQECACSHLAGLDARTSCCPTKPFGLARTTPLIKSYCVTKRQWYLLKDTIFHQYCS